MHQSPAYISDVIKTDSPKAPVSEKWLFWHVTEIIWEKKDVTS